jgi:hypothetical protein
MLNSSENKLHHKDSMSRGFKITLLSIALLLAAVFVPAYINRGNPTCSGYLYNGVGKADLCIYPSPEPEYNLTCIDGPSKEFPTAKQVCYSTFVKWELFGYYFGSEVLPYVYIDKYGVRYPTR